MLRIPPIITASIDRFASPSAHRVALAIIEKKQETDNSRGKHDSCVCCSGRGGPSRADITEDILRKQKQGDAIEKSEE